MSFTRHTYTKIYLPSRQTSFGVRKQASKPHYNQKWWWWYIKMFFPLGEERTCCKSPSSIIFSSDKFSWSWEIWAANRSEEGGNGAQIKQLFHSLLESVHDSNIHIKFEKIRNCLNNIEHNWKLRAHQILKDEIHTHSLISIFHQ